MKVPPEDNSSQPTELQTALRRLKKTAHRGVQLRGPEGRNPNWRVKWVDVETGQTRVQVLPPDAAKNADTRTAYAVRLWKQLRRRKEEIKAGARPHVESALSVEQALGKYFSGHDLNPQALKVYRAAADDLLSWCAGQSVRTVRDLNKARLFEFRTWLKTAPKLVPRSGGRKGEYEKSSGVRSVSSVNKVLRALSAILNVLRAADVVRLHSDEIKDSLKRYKTETERRDFLRAKQIRALLAEVSDTRFAPLVRCMLLTGLRLEEVLGIEWRDIDSDVLHVRAEIAKGGKKRDVDLTVAPTAFGPRGEDNERCFRLSAGEVRGAYESSKTKWTPHMLRRTWSTFFVCAFGPWRASKSAGHGLLVMERSYAGLVKVPEGCRSLEEAMEISKSPQT